MTMERDAPTVMGAVDFLAARYGVDGEHCYSESAVRRFKRRLADYLIGKWVEPSGFRYRMTDDFCAWLRRCRRPVPVAISPEERLKWVQVEGEMLSLVPHRNPVLCAAKRVRRAVR